MPSDTFAFKKFTVKQDKCAMKVNTDSVLLGAWVHPNGSKDILEIGTGTGVIAMMLAQKTGARIVAIDIDEGSAKQAEQNVKENNFSTIEVRHVSVQDFAFHTDEKFNMIVTNPPYFIGSLTSPDENRTKARHTSSLPFEDLISCVVKLMHEKGKFCLILPKNEASIFREMAKLKGLYLSKLLRVRTRADKSTEKRHLMQFEFKETEFSESTLVIENDKPGSYTDEYKELTRDYYLNF